MNCRGGSKEDDSRWLSGTYLLIHPAAKHLGNARVRVKVLLELRPQSSSRASSRQWQVPQVIPTVIRAVGHGPTGAAGNSPSNSNVHSSGRLDQQRTAAMPAVTAQKPDAAAEDESVEINKNPDAEQLQTARVTTAYKPQMPHLSFSHDTCAVSAQQPRSALSQAAATPSAGHQMRASQDLAAADDVRAEATSAGQSPHQQPDVNKSAAGTSSSSPETAKASSHQHHGIEDAPDARDLSSSQPVTLDQTPRSAAEKADNTAMSMELCIERALHIVLPPPASAAPPSSLAASTAGSSDCQGCLAVAFEHEGVTGSTPAVALSEAASAVWQHRVELPGATAVAASVEQQWQTSLQLKVCHAPLCQLGSYHIDNNENNVLHVLTWC